MNVTDAGLRWLKQNTTAAEGLTDAELEVVHATARPHSGGLYVLSTEVAPRVFVKVHDSWGDPDDGVVVHLYDADEPEEGPMLDVMQFTQTGSEAIALMLRLEALGIGGPA